jgi:exosortase
MTPNIDIRPVETASATGQPGRGVLLFAVLSALLLAVYWRTLVQTADFLVFSEDMAHGFFAPIVAGYIAWSKRDVAFRSPSRPSPWGPVVLGIAATVAVVATIGESTTIARFALLLSIAGCILLGGGMRALRILIFPLGLLLFTFPLPQVLYGEITLPLQLIATKMSEWALELLGFSVMSEGNILNLPHQRLSVVEACSGLRSLITLGFFCLVYAYFFEANRWLKAAIVASVLPFAILLNALRITMTGVFGEYAPQLTHGVYHEILGWSCFAAAFGLVLLFHRLLARLFGAPHV